MDQFEVFADLCVLVFFFQVMGHRGHCTPLPPGTDLGIRAHVHQREHHCHGLPFHHIQFTAGDVYLHIPLCVAEEGNFYLQCFMHAWSSSHLKTSLLL